MTEERNVANTDQLLAEEALSLEALLVARAHLYTLFHKCFGAAPTAELLEAATGDATLSVVEEYADSNASMAGLLTFLKGLRDASAEELLDAARDEYVRIFVGPGNLPASPYESPYTGAHDMALFQENTVAVRGVYHENGLRACKELRVPDDHVSMMCHFVALLGDRSLAALEAGDAAALASGLRRQSAFVDGHLVHWLGTYAESVRNSKAGAAAVLYPQMIEALAAFVQVDSTFLKEAAYWAEQAQGALPATPARFPEARASLAALQALDLFALSDNQLVTC